MLSDAESAPHMTATATRPSSGGGGIRSAAAPSPRATWATSSATSSARCSTWAAARRGLARAARPRPAIRHALEFEEAVFGVEREITIRRPETCDDCKGTGSAKGKQPETCTAVRRTRPDPLPAGLLLGGADLLGLQRHRQLSSDAMHRPATARRRQVTSTRSWSRFLRASSRIRAFATRARAKPAGSAARLAISTWC